MFNDVLASVTEPRGIVWHVIVLVQISSVASWVDNDHAHVALIERIFLLALLREADVTVPVLLFGELSHYYLGVFLPKSPHFGRQVHVKLLGRGLFTGRLLLIFAGVIREGSLGALFAAYSVNLLHDLVLVNRELRVLTREGFVPLPHLMA